MNQLRVLSMQISLLDLLVLAFSTFAIAHYVTREDGPFAVFYHLRKVVGAEVEVDDVAMLGDEAFHTEPPPQVKRGGLAQLFSCPYCMLPYAAVASAALWVVAPPIALLLAVAGASVFLLMVGDR